MRATRSWMLGIAMALLLGIATAKGASTGKLRVLTVDEGGVPLGGVTVVATVRNTGQTVQAITDGKGNAVLVGLPGGEVVVRFEAPGRQIYERNARILVGDTERVEAVLPRLVQEPVQPKVEADDPAARARGALQQANEKFDSGDVAGAEAAVSDALAADPSLAQAHVLKGKILARGGKAGGAADAYIEALKRDPSLQVLIPAIVTELQKAGRTAEAASYAKGLQTDQADTPGKLYNLAIVKLNAGDDAGALPLLEKALTLDPSHPPSLYQRGMVRLRGGDMAGCKADVIRYLELDPSGPFAAEARDILAALAKP